jgi:hypothetical protein
MEKCGLMPASSWICCFNSSSVKVSIPQSVWWIRHDLARPEQALGDRQGRISSSVMTPPAFAYHVRVALLEAEHPVDVEPGVHARDHATPLAGGSGGPLVEGSA